MSALEPQHPRLQISRPELLWLASAVVFGVILRLGFPGRMAIEHFDEGVYASNIWFGDEMGYEYPARYLYAPPLLPALIEWTIIFASSAGLKPTGWIPMLPCLLAGIAMIPSIWWVGRNWFGQTAGLMSAWLVATSDFHASYSRAALTDVPVALLILWAVYFISHAVQGRNLIASATDGNRGLSADIQGPGLNWIRIVQAAVVTGLAWWTKYNGWLPLAIGLAGAACWQLLTASSQRQILSVAIRWCLVSGLAWLIWSPVVAELQDRGGYASVAANHRQYLVGLQGWPHSVLSQSRHVGIYENWFGWITETMHLRSTNEVAVMLAPVLLQVLAGLSILSGLRSCASAPRKLAICLLATWYCGMTISTPFYYPYPRLVLPWLVAIWLACGLGAELWSRRARKPKVTDDSACTTTSFPSTSLCVLVALLALNSIVRSLSGTAHAYQDRNSLAEVAEKVATRIRQQSGDMSPQTTDAIVYVWGEPALVYGLRVNGVTNVLPITNLNIVGDRQPLPVYLVFGKQAQDSSTMAEQQNALSQCRLIETFQIHPSHLVLLDSRDSLDSSSPEALVSQVWLYRVP